MVRFLLTGWRGQWRRSWRGAFIGAGFVALLGLPAGAARQPKETAHPPAPPELLLEGGRKLTFERSFSLEREVNPKRGFWTKVVDAI
ncbi:MAG TPA: hypothetical protein VNO32_64210, partial [Candidatus Acidoferrum sp.]|nr:hypothetical protein [Candidatus Acidoferrum sp.]